MENELTTHNPLTGKLLEFAKNVANGMNKTGAARAAGYAYPKQEAQRLINDPRIQEYLQRDIARRVQTQGQVIAFNFLLDTVQNAKAPWGARVDCARIITSKGPLNEHAIKAAADKAAGNKPLEERSIEELEAFIKGGQAAIGKLKEKRAITVEATDVSAQSIAVIPDKSLIEE